MNKGHQFNRRNFLGATAALGVVSSLKISPPLLTAQTLTKDKVTPVEFKRRLQGAIMNIPTPFTSDFRIDVPAVRRMIERSLSKGINIFEVTYGDGRLWCLSDEEIKELARIVVQAVDGRGMTIICTGPWWTQKTVEFARYLESIGATAMEVLLPPNGDEDGYVRHFEELARNTRLALVLRGSNMRFDLSIKLVSRLMQIDSVVAMKHDVDETFFREVLIHQRGRLNSYAGGPWEWFLVGQPYGATASFDVYSSFAPEISVRFWKAIAANDLKTAREMVEKYEHPWIYHQFSYAFWHGTLEYFGVASRYLRPPEPYYTDQEMAKLKTFYDKLELYPEK